jgi:hypothetical protein
MRDCGVQAFCYTRPKLKPRSFNTPHQMLPEPSPWSPASYSSALQKQNQAPIWCQALGVLRFKDQTSDEEAFKQVQEALWDV